MTIEEKIKINKEIRSYEGDNSFILSLQKQLKSNNKLSKVEFNGRNVKVLSDKQYSVAINLLDE